MAMISDNDPIYELLDKWHEEDQYEKILEKIAEIPLEERSNKLWFRKISALNNMKRFSEARMEIGTLAKRCTEDKDTAKLFYMLGYIYDNTDSELKAVECYRHTRALDPEYEGLQELIDSAMEYVNKDMEGVQNSFGKLFPDAKSAFEKEEDPRDLDETEAFQYIALVESSFIPSGLGVKVPLDQPFFKCGEEDKEKVKALLSSKFGVTDIGSLREWFGKNRNGQHLAEVMMALDEEVEIPVEKMSIAGRTRFDADQLVIRYLKGFLPKAGILAWDFCAVLALARLAFAVDLLSNTEFVETTLFFTDECRRNFDSWEEFTRSLVVGAFYSAMCFETSYDINSAARFAIGTGILCMQNYPKLKWIGSK